MPNKAKKTAAKKTTTAKKAKMTKADYVRSQPSDMPAKDMIAKAKEAGIKLTEDTIYKTRSQDKKRTKKAGGKKVAAGSQAKTSGRGDKKQRVLEVVAKNPDWTADQVAKAAKCSVTYVYSVWKTKPTVSAPKGTPSTGNGAVTAFYRAVKGVGGVLKAQELLTTIEAFQNA